MSPKESSKLPRELAIEPNENDPHSQNEDATHIDLGEDLLDKTAVLVRGAPSLPQITPVEDTELLENAKILAQEGLLDDAKKTLREVIRRDPNHRVALQALDELQKQELKQIFGTEEIRSHYGKPKSSETEINPEEILRQLDQDLNLGLFSEGAFSLATAQRALFDESRTQDALVLELQSQLIHGVAQDWIDLGVAFLEMNLYPLATRFFTEACRKLDLEALDSAEWKESTESGEFSKSKVHYQNRLSATGLLALSLISDGKHYDAVSKIQPFLHDSEISHSDKVEFYYLMGRVYEAVQKQELAEHYFNEVAKIDPGYRDNPEKLKRNRIAKT